MPDGASQPISACALPIYQLDANGQVLGVNPALAALLGSEGPWPAPAKLPAGSAGGLDGRLWRPPGSEARVLYAAEQAGADGQVWGVVIEVNQALPSAEAPPPSASGTDTLLVDMAHELRGPLNAVIGFSEVLENAQSPPLEGGHRAAVAHIARSGERLLLMLEGLLNLSRARLGRLAAHQVLTHPDTLWRGVQDEWAPELIAKDMRWAPWLEGLPVKPSTPRPLAAERLRELLAHLLALAVRSQLPGTVWQARIDDSDDNHSAGWVWQLVEAPGHPGPAAAAQWHDGHWALCLQLAQHSGAELRPQAHPGGRRGLWLRWPAGG